MAKALDINVFTIKKAPKENQSALGGVENELSDPINDEEMG